MARTGHTLPDLIPTKRLNLVIARPAIARADLAGPMALAEELGVGVPASWPPELYDDDARAFALARLESAPEEIGWWHFYVVECEPMPTLAGIVGYKGPPDAEGTVEVGYSILPERRGRGLAEEAVQALIDRAFERPDVKRVVAETLPGLAPSIRVLEKLGFEPTGAGSEAGVLRFVLEKGGRERGSGDQEVGM